MSPSENPIIDNNIRSSRDLPDFLYIGASKSGSSWISQILKEHPQVFIPRVKDVQFFDHHFHMGMDWYRSFFSTRQDEKVSGELSHDYFLVPGCAERIHHHLPDAKLIVCLREPIERAVSRYVYALAHDIKPSVSIDDYLLRPRILAEGLYGQNLQPFMKIFDRNKILILFYNDMVRSPEIFVRRIYDFLDVDSAFIPPSLHTRILEARSVRFPLLGRLAGSTATHLRRLGLAGIVGSIKHHPLWNGFIYGRPSVKPTPSAELREQLRLAYADDQVILQELLGFQPPWELL